MKLVDLEAAGGAEVGAAGAGAELSSAEGPPPRVLPTPWKADRVRGLIDSYMTKQERINVLELRHNGTGSAIDG